MSTLAKEDPKRAIANAMARLRLTVANSKKLIEDRCDLTIVEAIEEAVEDESAIIAEALGALGG